MSCYVTCYSSFSRYIQLPMVNAPASDCSLRDPLSDWKSHLPFLAQLLVISSSLSQSASEEGICLQNTEAAIRITIPKSWQYSVVSVQKSTFR